MYIYKLNPDLPQSYIHQENALLYESKCSIYDVAFLYRN